MTDYTLKETHDDYVVIIEGQEISIGKLIEQRKELLESLETAKLILEDIACYDPEVKTCQWLYKAIAKAKGE